MPVTAAVHAKKMHHSSRSARAAAVSRLFLFLLLLGTSLGMTRSEPLGQARSESVSRVAALPVVLDPEGGRRSVGALRFIEGWELRSADSRFGGISAMGLTPDGFVALSDSGTVMWLAGRNRRPERLRLLPLPAGPGDGTQKADRDGEALARDAAGHIWVAYEQHNSVWRYAPDFRHSEANRAPPEMRRWRPNSGAEAMVRLDDGRFLIFSEGPGSVPRSSDVLLFDRDPTDPAARAARLSYRLPEGFAVTDAALLGDGRLLTLHRSASVMHGMAASLGVVDVPQVKAGAVLTPRMLATLRPPLTVDNMEALAVERRGAATRIWIASDDNFNTVQRTLLMQFELEEPRRLGR